MEDQLFNNSQPNESEEDRKIRELFFDEPVWDGKKYTVPVSGTFNICGFVMDLKPGDIVKIDEVTGVPYITSPS